MVRVVLKSSQLQHPFVLLWVSYERALVVHVDALERTSLQNIRCQASVRSITAVEKRTPQQKARIKAFFASIARLVSSAELFAIAGPDAAKFELRDYLKENKISLAGLSFFARCESSSTDSVVSLAIKMKQLARPATLEPETLHPQPDTPLHALRKRALEASLRKARLSARYRYN